MKKTLKSSNVLIMTSLIIILGYVFFFTSSFLFGQNHKYAYTGLMQELTLNGRRIKITRWDYSAEQKLMEVELEINNDTYDNIDKYYYVAVTKPAGKIIVEPIIQDSNFVVLHLKNIPNDFTEISLRMKVADNSYTDILKMYNNIDKVSKVNDIQALTKDEYYINRLSRTIEDYNNQISECNKNIEEYKTQISTIEEKISILESDKKYQTEQEIKETDIKIANNNSNINNIKQLIELKEQSIKELEDKISKAIEKIESIKS